MPFSTSFCLTNTGNLPSNTTLSFYSNADGYMVPFQITVPLFSVTGNNCPFTLTGVYDGTTIIKVQTSAGNCCAVINITPNDPCTFCNLGFDTFSAATIGEIVAQQLAIYAVEREASKHPERFTDPSSAFARQQEFVPRFIQLLQIILLESE